MERRQGAASGWPELATPGWMESSRTLHLWTQIAGKTRLALAPMTNHWWQVPLYVTARGLGTSLIPWRAGGFEVEFDLLASRLEVRTTDGAVDGFPLGPGTLADFHARYFEVLHGLGIDVSINPLAVELQDTLYLDRDRTERRYDADWARRFFTALVRVERLLEAFRGEFVGKSSPVHFFWGSFDLAVTRFSGRRAPRHPGGAPHLADAVMREAYSHEVSSAGFWPGGPEFKEAAFYSYAYPEPAGYPAAPVLPEGVRYEPAMKVFILPYAAVRAAPSPERMVRTFLQTTYVAAAELGGWPRAELERSDDVRL